MKRGSYRKGALTEIIPVDLFSGLLKEFLARAPGRLLHTCLSNYVGGGEVGVYKVQACPKVCR